MDSENSFVLWIAVAVAEALFALVLMWLFSMDGGTAVVVSIIVSFLVACVVGAVQVLRNWKLSRMAKRQGQADGNNNHYLDR